MSGDLALFDAAEMCAPVVEEMRRTADISPDGRYRYALRRAWSPGRRSVMFVGLNPSIADAHVDDPTLRRCIGFARAWGFAGLFMGNLFALRSSYPRDLLDGRDPIGGPATDIALQAMRRQSELCIAAWGQHTIAKQRETHVLDLLGDVSVLGLCADGSPRHPLYMRGDTLPTPWTAPC